MINITEQNKSQCCGCNACGDACAKQAITFKTDIEGFWYPEVNKDLCTDCGLCEKVCPVINIEALKKNDFKEPLCYAAMHKNLEVRFDSTSGGLFSAFAEKFYRDGGYVGGAIANPDGSVKQFISNDKNDLHAIRRSKYEQSNLEGFFKQVKELLNKGEKVVVCGAPCQMTALRSYLRKDYENLLILDFVCRGINSPFINKCYASYLESKHNSKIVESRAKSKELGWDRLTFKARFKNGEIEFQTKDNSLATRGYLQTGAYCRPSCYECKFKGFPRIADISLADFWGIKEIVPEMYDNIGTSLVLINSEKGKRFFDTISQKIKAVELPYETALKGNPALTKPLTSAKIDRKAFFEDAHKLPYDELAKKYFNLPTGKHSFKDFLKQCYRLAREIKNIGPWYRPYARWQFIQYNFLYKNIKTNFWSLGYLFPRTFDTIKISRKAKIVLNAPFYIGHKHYSKSHVETQFMVEDGAHVEVNERWGFMPGSDIEVFKNAKLIINEAEFPTNGGTNVNFNLICGDKIEIGYNVMIGRNVTIRDNNGGHYLNMQGYKNTRPVKIGNHVWLCEGCTIMPGAKIGDGAVIGAHAVVYGSIPPNSMAVGNPAKVVETNIEWKY